MYQIIGNMLKVIEHTAACNAFEFLSILPGFLYLVRSLGGFLWVFFLHLVSASR